MAGRSIPRRIGPDHVPGDFRTLCDYCGAAYLRSKLQRDANGLLFCPGEGEGLSSNALDDINAASAPVLYEYDGVDGAIDPPSTDTAPVLEFFQGPPWR